MFKLFFIVPILSAIFLWYFHEYHTSKFLDVFNSIPYCSPVLSKIHFYLSSTSPVFKVFNVTSTKVFTPEELKQYDGEKNSKGLYIAILGEVYDVSKGYKHYGPGGPYHVFAGKDASRSFITGNFKSETQEDHVLDLTFGELLSLRDWSKFYKKEYSYKGKLAGRYYTNEGIKTEYWEMLQKKINEAEKNEKLKKDDEHIFPPCNVEWNAESGTKVWCSNKSGGIKRNWIGVPRKLFMVGSESYRCACIDLNQFQNSDSPQYARRGHIQQYENCDPLQAVCLVKE